MKRVRLPGVVDVITVDDPTLINSLSEDGRIGRRFRSFPLFTGMRMNHLIRTLSYKGTRFPHLVPRNDGGRQSRQDRLWELFSAKAARMAAGPEELEPLARWIKGEDTLMEPGVLVQQVVGSFWSHQYRSTPESWAAAVTLSTAARSRSWVKRIWWGITGKTRRARRLLGSMANDDIVFLHGTAVGVHNIVASIRTMKRIFKDEGLRRSVTPESAAERCLTPPPVVFRQANLAGRVGGCPFAKGSLLRLNLRDAYIATGAREMIFMSKSWSRCPAEQWVPAVLAGIWRRACE